MNYQFKERIEQLLKEGRHSKKSLYEYLGMTAPGLDYMLKNNTLTQKRVEQIAAFFSMSVAELTEENLAKSVEQPGTFGAQVAERILAEFEKLREQLSIKDKQLEAADKRAEGLQRTIDSLINRPNIMAGSNFLKGASTQSRIIPLMPFLRKAV